MVTVQKGNTSGRDIAGRDIYNIYERQKSPLEILYEQLRSENENDVLAKDIADKLQHYCKKLEHGDVRGLEQKLISAGRADLIDLANTLKQEATKLIMRTQTSPAAQTIIMHILCKLYVAHVMFVQPAVQSGRSREEVDSIVHDKVIAPVEAMLGANDLHISMADLLGLVYFLCGNCHIRWDKC